MTACSSHDAVASLAGREQASCSSLQRHRHTAAPCCLSCLPRHAGGGTARQPDASGRLSISSPITSALVTRGPRSPGCGGRRHEATCSPARGRWAPLPAGCCVVRTALHKPCSGPPCGALQTALPCLQPAPLLADACPTMDAAFLLALVAAAAAARRTASSAARRTPADAPRYVPGTVLVRLKPTPAAAAAAAGSQPNAPLAGLQLVGLQGEHHSIPDDGSTPGGGVSSKAPAAAAAVPRLPTGAVLRFRITGATSVEEKVAQLRANAGMQLQGTEQFRRQLRWERVVLLHGRWRYSSTHPCMPSLLARLQPPAKLAPALQPWRRPSLTICTTRSGCPRTASFHLLTCGRACGTSGPSGRHRPGT